VQERQTEIEARDRTFVQLQRSPVLRDRSRQVALQVEIPAEVDARRPLCGIGGQRPLVGSGGLGNITVQERGLTEANIERGGVVSQRQGASPAEMSAVPSTPYNSPSRGSTAMAWRLVAIASA